MKLFTKKGKPATVEEIAEAYVQCTTGTIGSQLENPRQVRDFLRARLQELPHEVFCVIFLDNRHRVIAFEEMFRGTIDGAPVYPREIVKAILSHNAAAIILSHNHPSGIAEPSAADECITQKIKTACDTIDVRLLDHMVVGKNNIVSMAERGIGGF